ncbi:hypothetical protein SAMN02949497_3544 [Methylomagnum ishizawai]|uniref:CHC2 zinc finger n=1 Tax=Methylomagnum ishizawai TaxID=1760988 RepID=A0A1Y6CZP4_9GAMM|nr:hypothetical protein [Methylomagnum ishizawai]SMF96159.1 hypothetical protein SAMN02949497_3544 [Methylomagnum ishizawai]
MSTPLETVLARLERVKPRANGRGYMASCPTAAHRRGDRNASLSVDEGDNGGVILYCFSHQCSADAIVAALGLELSDLFPQRLDYRGPKSTIPPVPLREVFAAIEIPLVAVSIAFNRLAAGESFTPAEAACLKVQSEILWDAIQRARGHRGQ